MNEQIDVDECLLLVVVEIYAGLTGGKHFTFLDLQKAYLHMEVEEES